MSRKVAIVLFGTVMLFGIASGMIVQAYDNHAMQKMLDMFDANFANQNLPRIKSDEITAAVPVAFESALQSNSELFYESPDIIIRSIDHIKRNAYSESPFTRFDGNGFGFNTYHEFVPLDLSTPFSMGRGISSGDYDNDGWPDVVLSTSKGILLYKNLGTNKFALQQIIVPDLNALVVAFVDINNDGWLDIYVTSYGGDNHFILSDGASFDQPEIINVPNTGALATASSSFGDINKDGWLDFVNGNWFFENSLPVDEATNKLIINRALEFEEKDFDRPGASTLSILFTDFNNDNNLDLIEGNDFEEPDIYYVGNGEGELRKITKTEGMIPITTLETMSIDTADINNDLLPDIYLGGISISFSQGKDKKKRFDEYCSDLKNNEIKSECEKYVNTVIAVRETDLEQCSTFADSDKNECMVMVMLRLAIQKRDERLCEKIPEAYQLHKSICHKYFTPSPLVSYADSIQQHANVNILLQGMSDGTFKDASQMGVSGGFWTWNAKFADLDNDEWQDIYVANGFWELRDLFSNVFFHNNNGKDFSAMQEQSGLENFLSVNTYTYIDIDNDGDMDIISVTTHGLIEVYINNEHENNAVTFEFRDEQGNVYGIGNKIYIYYDSNAQFREIKSGGGFMSFDAPIAHFGLGKHDKIDRIEIVWSTGEKTTIEKNFTANKRYLMTRKHITSVAAH